MFWMWLPAVLGEIDQPRGDLFVGQSVGDEAQHLDLACGQPGRSFSASQDSVPGGREHCLDRIRVESSALERRRGARAAASADRAWRGTAEVRASLGTRRPRRGCAHARDGAAAQASWVAGAVEPLAVLHRDAGEWFERRRLLKHPLGEVGVHAHSFPFAGSEWAALVPDRVRNAEPAEVVHQARPIQQLHLIVGKTELLAGGRRELGDGGRVARA